MASVIKENKYYKMLRRLFPDGFAWQNKYDINTNLGKFIFSSSQEFCRVDDRGFDLLKEIDPNTTMELLEDWERLCGLPDECSPTDEVLTIQERRNRILQVLTTRGGQNEDFYKQLASNFGYDIDVIEVVDQPPFRAGYSRAGDKLTNGDWRYTFIINAPADAYVRFRAGQSLAGDPLLKVQNDVLECLMEKHKPAHTIVIFTFG